MSRFLILLVLLAVGILGVGYYLKWFNINADKTSDKPNVTLSLDQGKFNDDRKAAEAKVQDLGRQIKDQVTTNASHDGRIVSVNSDQLVMTNTNDKTEHTHALTIDTNITCDGKVCLMTELKPGMKIRVTSESAKPYKATRIEALDVHLDFNKAG